MAFQNPIRNLMGFRGGAEWGKGDRKAGKEEGAPKQLDYAEHGWVCSAGTDRYATANAARIKEENQRTIKQRY